MTVMLIVLPGLFAWSAIRRWKLAAAGAPEPRFSIAGEALPQRIKDTLIYALGQKKMPYYFTAGIAHILIFIAFQVLLLNSILLWGRGYDPSFDFWGLLSLDHWFGKLYSIAKELAAAGAVLGSAVFVYYRVIHKQRRMTLGFEGLLILGIIITMMLADFLYNGARLVLDHRAADIPLHFSLWEPVASPLAMSFANAELGNGTLRVLMHIGFWWHSAFVLIFLNILPYSKHFHIVTAGLNVFMHDLKPNRLPAIVDLEGKVEREEPIGFAKITDLSWKDALDLYTCTECGRCSDNCPAYTTGKKLSPKHLTLALRNHLYECEPTLFKSETADPSKPAADGAEHRHELDHSDPPKDGYFVSDKIVDLVPNIIHPDVIWACTSCRACEEQCPVLISYVDKIVSMRRDQVMIKNEFPAELMKPFNGIETNGNPWNLAASDRANWADGMGIPLIGDKPDAKVLYWVGCAASYDDRAKKIARATAKLMKQAGVEFAILGTEESCTGDPARRAGNEYLFQMMAQQNVETLKSHQAEKKTIVTTCPHCFNTLKNEYPDFGGHYDVVHHTSFLSGLIDAKRLVPKNRVEKTVAFHDSCYLGRYNDVYDAPRKVLEAIPGVQLREVNYWNKNKGLCCGAGGAQMFKEEHEGQRVNVKRTLQLLETGAQTIASGCPFCMTMLTDGLKAHEKEESVQQKDVAELLAESALGGAVVAEAAE
jgi:Fe-S oxidoreductase